MSAGSKARRSGDARAAAAAVRRRGLQIFALAFLFRFQAFVLSNGPAWTLLKVDILNVMGPAIMVAATLWFVCGSFRARLAAFGLGTAAIVLATPVIRSIGALAALPDPIEGYLRPIPNLAALTNFTLFPWSGFVMAGAALGVILDAARTPEQDRRVNLAFLAGGLAVAVAAFEASFFPPIHPRSSFWTTSLSFFFIRAGLMTAAIGAAWLWEQRPTHGRRWSPLQVLGTSSLFIYWIHVEMVYGLISNPLHGRFSVPGAWAALAMFSLLMLGAAVLKDRLRPKWRFMSALRGKLSRRVQPLMF